MLSPLHCQKVFISLPIQQQFYPPEASRHLPGGPSQASEQSYALTASGAQMSRCKHSTSWTVETRDSHIQRSPGTGLQKFPLQAPLRFHASEPPRVLLLFLSYLTIGYLKNSPVFGGKVFIQDWYNPVVIILFTIWIRKV